MHFKIHSCERINSFTESAHANTEASVSGYRLDSGTRSNNFEIFARSISILQDRTLPGKKDEKLNARCFGHTNRGVIFVLCSGRTRCCKPGVSKSLPCSHLRISLKKLL